MVGRASSSVEADAREKHYWVNPRDHARRKTKKEIWERVVMHSTSHPPHSTQTSTEQGQDKEGDVEPAEPSVPQLHDRKWVASTLRRIVADDASYFSLSTLHRHRDALERPVHAELLYEHDVVEEENEDEDDGGAGSETEDELILESQPVRGDLPQQRPCRRRERRLVAHDGLLSRLGLDPFEKLCLRLNQLQSFTFYEYAAWVGRPRIVAALLLGGINPCVRGRHVTVVADPIAESDHKERQALDDLQRLGMERVLPRFFDGVPLSLSTYVVQRVVELRTQDLSSSLATSFSCPLCCESGREVPTRIILAFRSKSCNHMCCEPCLWKDVVRNLTDRLPDEDVVQCPVCSSGSAVSSNGSMEECSLHPAVRRKQSLEKFLSLPADAAELKRVATVSRRQHVKCARPAVASTWSDAVRPLVGRSKEVRRDRFWRYVEDPRRTYHHYVRGCVEQGIDVLETNQYGQTPLFVAAMSGNIRVVQLLLRYHSPDDVLVTGTAHGGVNLVSAAKVNGHDDIVKILLDYMGTGPAGNYEYSSSSPHVPLPCLRHEGEVLRLRQPAFTVLIDPEAELPGAGSYLIDDCLCERSVQILETLWTVLPDATDVKKKDVPCSTRRYFCDSEGHIQSALVAAMAPFFDDSCVVFPHMRFLCYSEPNTTLLPHVDLPRTDAVSGIRSTHTLLLYLTDCEEGGATCLLDRLTESDRSVVARVRPRRARLFLFPHECPHEGEAVVDVPKLLLRGEAWLPNYCRHKEL